jgi:xylan 1,4-beta-xylosidase
MSKRWRLILLLIVGLGEFSHQDYRLRGRARFQPRLKGALTPDLSCRTEWFVSDEPFSAAGVGELKEDTLTAGLKPGPSGRTREKYVSGTAELLAHQLVVLIRVNASEKEGPFRPVWAWVGHDEPNYTYSKQGRELLRELSQLSFYPFHDRTHNLLTTGDGSAALKWGSTNAYELDAAGRPVYNWAIVDQIFDTYRSAGVIPFVEIGFMPKALSTHPEPYRHHWPSGPLFTGWSYPPSGYAAWADLVRDWVKHMVRRYGADEVKQWEWEVWNEPNIGYWHGTFRQYCKLYDYTAGAVKRVLPDARVGGPATTGPGNPDAAEFLKAFLNHCISGRNYSNGQIGAPLNFISFHAKGQTRFIDGLVEMDIGHHLRDTQQGFRILANFPTLRGLPVVISESDPEGCAACAAVSHPENGYRLTSQYASYEAELLDRTLALSERYHVNLQGTVTWAFTFPGQPVFAGFRALTTDGIDLPVLDLFRMLGLMQGERVASTSSGALALDDILRRSVRARPDVNAIAARDANALAVLVWNYDDKSAPGASAEVKLTVNELPEAVRHALLEHYRIDRDHSNSYMEWRETGSPRHPSPAQHAVLKAAGQLQLFEPPRWLAIKRGAVSLSFTEPAQSVSLLRLTW